MYFCVSVFHCVSNYSTSSLFTQTSPLVSLLFGQTKKRETVSIFTGHLSKVFHQSVFVYLRLKVFQQRRIYHAWLFVKIIGRVRNCPDITKLNSCLVFYYFLSLCPFILTKKRDTVSIFTGHLSKVFHQSVFVYCVL